MFAALATFVTFVWLAGRLPVLRERNIWSGFGLGLILGTLACLLIAVVETSPFASAVPGKGLWHLVIVPVASMLGAGLVNVKRILEEERAGGTLPSAAEKNR